jgi:hypothetical protein
MSILDIVVLVLMAVGIVAFLGEPLLRQDTGDALPDAYADEGEMLLLQKETLYTAIRDLDFDYHTGKVDQQDYAELRHRLEDEAIATLRRLDTVDPLAALDSEIERQIAALRQGNDGGIGGTTSMSKSCHGCGVMLQGEANFCAFCGYPLTNRHEEEASS